MAKPRQSVDLGLAVLAAVSPRGRQWQFPEIADVCGCSVERIRQIEADALRKLRRHSRALHELRTEAGLSGGLPQKLKRRRVFSDVRRDPHAQSV